MRYPPLPSLSALLTCCIFIPIFGETKKKGSAKQNWFFRSTQKYCELKGISRTDRTLIRNTFGAAFNFTVSIIGRRLLLYWSLIHVIKSWTVDYKLLKSSARSWTISRGCVSGSSSFNPLIVPLTQLIHCRTVPPTPVLSSHYNYVLYCVWVSCDVYIEHLREMWWTSVRSPQTAAASLILLECFCCFPLNWSLCQESLILPALAPHSCALGWATGRPAVMDVDPRTPWEAVVSTSHSVMCHCVPPYHPALLFQ